MATTGWKLPGTAANGVTGETGTVGWTNPDNIKVENTSNAQALNNIGGFGTKDTRTLRATNFGFTSSDIPVGSLIVGIEIQITRRAVSNSGVGATDTTVRLVSGSAGSTADRIGSNKADTTTLWGLTSADVFYGSTSDDWGAGLTQAAVTSASFGVDFEAHLSYNNRADVFYIKARVTYLPPISAALATSEDGDSISAAAVTPIKGSAGITEADDTVAAGSIPIKEADDTVAASGRVLVQGSAAIVEAGDTLTAAGAVHVQGSASLSESGDVLTALARAFLHASLALAEEGDGMAATAISGPAAVAPAERTAMLAGSTLVDRTAQLSGSRIVDRTVRL